MIVGLMCAFLIFVIGFANYLQIGGHAVAGWIVPLSLLGVGACWLQMAELRKQRLRVIRTGV